MITCCSSIIFTLIVLLYNTILICSSELSIVSTFIPESDTCKNRKSAVGDRLTVHYIGDSLLLLLRTL